MPDKESSTHFQDADKHTITASIGSRMLQELLYVLHLLSNKTTEPKNLLKLQIILEFD
jgi:hypothetical protein